MKKSLKISGITVLMFIAVWTTSCSDDEGNTFTPIPIRDRGEQQIADNDSIVNYLKTHYYNSSAFESLTVKNIDSIKIGMLSDTETTPPEGHTLLFDAIETKTTTFENTNYQYYILRLNQGGGTTSPTFADDVLVRYEGFLLDDTIFDRVVNPDIFLDLTLLIFGWTKVFPEFNEASGFVENSDGTLAYTDPGIGIMFLPSGMAYFNGTGPNFNLPQYAPLIFKFELFKAVELDHDNDGVPSYLEDIDGNGVLFNDDSNNNGTPNFLDSEDIISIL